MLGFKVAYKQSVVICFQTLDLRSLITTLLFLNKTKKVVICFQTLDLRSLITTIINFICKLSFVVICFQTLDLRSLITTKIVAKDNLVLCRCDLLSNFRFTFFDNNNIEST